MWATLLPDGELSLFEQRLLEAHCGHCAECRQVLEAVGGLTEIIRATPLEAIDRSVRVLRPRPAYARSVSGVLATSGAAALALALAFWVGPDRTRPRQLPAVTAPIIVFTPQSSSADVKRIWQLKRTHVMPAAGVRGTHRTGPGPTLA